MTETLETATPAVVHSAQGRDVSDYQPVQTVASWAGYNFGFAKATEGTGWTGSTFRQNWANLEVAVTSRGDFPVRGAYHFLHPGADPVAQAAHFMSVVGGAGLVPGDVLVCDSELPSGAAAGAPPARAVRQHVTADAAALATAQVDAATLAFCDEVARRAGARHPVVVYTMHAVGQYLHQTAQRYPLWFAWPSNTAPPASMIAPWSRWLFWQWGTAPGNGGDADAFNGTVADLAAWAARWQPHGPYRHVGTGETLSQIAARRGTTPRHLLDVSAAAYTDADLELLYNAPLKNVAWYSTNP